MDGEVKQKNGDLFKLYLEFLSLFNEQYPDCTIVIIGNRQDYGNEFAMELIMSN